MEYPGGRSGSFSPTATVPASSAGASLDNMIIDPPGNEFVFQRVTWLINELIC